jgi:biotin-dependent carboxylase-like uncharacterized protein
MTRLTVLDPGAMTLVQDLGRAGHAHLGVPPSGALDAGAHALANRLVGNPSDAAGLEILIGGVELRADESVRIALTGALTDLVVGGQRRPWGEAVSVPAGETVEVRPHTNGLRGWLAFAGGIVVPEVLGSAATDTLTGLGPDPLARDDVVRLGTTVGRSGAGAAVPRRHDETATELAVRLGPRDDWFTNEALARLGRTTYEVAADSNRIGVRLVATDGSSLTRSRSGELPSEGIVTGAVQVPGSGQPLVFLSDHPVTGGYPVIGVVDPGDLWKCAQLRPGDQMRFRVIA